MNHEQIRLLTQKELQRGANMISEGAEISRKASENLALLRCDDSGSMTVPIDKIQVAREKINFDNLGRFYDPVMPKEWWSSFDTDLVTGFNDGSFEVTAKPTISGSTKAQQSVLLTGSRRYQVSQTVTLLKPFSWSQGEHIGGKLGMGLTTYEVVTGGSQSKGGMSCRFGFREGLATLYTYHQKRNRQYGEDFILGALMVDVPVTLKMEVVLNSAFDKDDGSLRGWINGRLVVEQYNMLWQSESSIVRKGIRDLGIWFLRFSLFHGGDNSKWSPAHDNIFRFENINHGIS